MKLPTTSRSENLLPVLRRERNPSEARHLRVHQRAYARGILRRGIKWRLHLSLREFSLHSWRIKAFMSIQAPGDSLIKGFTALPLQPGFWEFLLFIPTLFLKIFKGKYFLSNPQ